METFVNKVAHYIKNSSVHLENWVIIIPSERAKQYLQKALFEAYGRPIFSPEIITIHQWIKKLSKEVLLDKTHLLLELFEVHRSIGKEKIDNSFDEFLQWGPMLLADFDEMERYLISPKELFVNLRDIKDLENWSFGEGVELSERQKRFLEFWDRLPAYYYAFSERLISKNTTTSGKAYRKVAENIDLVFEKNKSSHFLFCGFNALSKSEMLIMKQLEQLGRGHVLIDADAYYLEDPVHEAGSFLRAFQEFSGRKEWEFISDRMRTSEKKIELIGCAQITGQVKVMSTLLDGFSEEKIASTLVLLADESLIAPLLHSIPKKVGEANITLGLPLKKTVLRTWFDLVFKVQEGIVKYGKAIVYHKDLLAFWNHPFIYSCVNSSEKAEILEREKKMRKFNTIFQDPAKVKVSARIDAIFQLLYTPWGTNWAFAVQTMRKQLQLIFKELPVESDFEKAVIQSFDAGIIDFENCVIHDFPEMLLRTFKSLFHQEWGTFTMAYFGNPIDGLQIMGLLETRMLDFKTIIVVGMNEGSMPPTNPIQTLIPMDLRRYLELPLPRHKQGLFAHHFYRLLHHCDEMYITYATSSEGMNAMEKSRYLLQLELELAKFNPSISLVKRDYTLENSKSMTQKKVIEKSPEVIQKLDDLFCSGISASAIKTYLNCPLDFYYKYVLKFGEEEKVEEAVESSQLGTFVHEVLEDLYRPYCKREKDGTLKEKAPPHILEEDLNRMLEQYEYLMRQKFSVYFDGNPEAFTKGKNLLSFTMALELTERFLKHEKKELQASYNKSLQIESLEERLEAQLELDIFDDRKTVKVKGFVDRIDQMDGRLRIIDYKTGKVNAGDVGKKPGKSEVLDVNYLVQLSKNNKHFFQLMVYCFLYQHKYGVSPATSAIISLVNLKDSPFFIEMGDLSINELVELFPNVLKVLVEEIYDPEIPFTHTDAYRSYCQYCE